MAEEITEGKQTDAGKDSPVISASLLSPAKLNLRRLESIQRLLQYGAALVLLIFVGLIMVSYFEWRKIRREIADGRETVKQQRQAIENGKQEIKQNQETIEGQRALLAGFQELSREFSAKNVNQGEQTKQTIEKSIAQDVNPRQVPPRIYFQIAREDQRKRAAEVARQLQARGYIVPGIENVGRKARGPTELRYCHSDNIAQQDLVGITKTLTSLSIKIEPRFLRNCGNVRPRHYEIWFGDDF